ncbi:murein transglycosylase A [Amorphus sp. 3PC139-8]|uniref:murein transglycosylase A n=1 Tax=Amorphus sp. 3PC139-8 TaxID=2735676 RepID=UPI00345D7A33
MAEAEPPAATFAALAGWSDASVGAAFAAFRRHCPNIGQTFPVYEPACRAVRALPDEVDDDVARTFLEIWFRPVPIGGPEAGFVTGYFEPELAASRTEEPGFSVPVYRRPDDLVAIDADARNDDRLAGLSFARQTEAGLEPYPDRAAISAGALAGRGLELAWLADPVDAFFMQVQGSGRLRFRDGTTLRVSYAGKTGHPYTAIGRIVVARGHLSADALDYQSLRDWLKGHPDEARKIMDLNRSYIFFAPVDGLDEADGPVGAAGLPLIPEVSLAVDLDHHGFGELIWLDAALPASDTGEAVPFRRLMVAEDRGSAIVGPARGDIFFGSGPEAGDRAGRIKHRATLYRLEPRSIGPGE